MTVENISRLISMRVWNRAGIQLATPGSAVRHASVARQLTKCATRPGRRKVTMPDVSDLVPFHSGLIRYFFLLSWDKYEVIQFCTSNWINCFKQACCLKNNAGHDQLAL